LKPKAFAPFICAALFVVACQASPPTPPATLRTYVLGRWFLETVGDKFNRLEIDYAADGSVTAYQFRPVYRNTIPTAVPLVYRGTWRLRGMKLFHSWKPNAHETAVDVSDCDILELTPDALRLRDRQRGYLMNFYRDFRRPHLQ
jgi:hypothetical protein